MVNVLNTIGKIPNRMWPVFIQKTIISTTIQSENPPSQWTYFRQNPMYTTLSENRDTQPLTIIPTQQQQCCGFYPISIHEYPLSDIKDWVFLFVCKLVAFPTNDHLIAKGLCNSIFCLYSTSKEMKELL